MSGAERVGNPGPRDEHGSAAGSGVHPPHVTENDHGAQHQKSNTSPTEVPALPANSGGSDRQPDAREQPPIDDESMYEHRPEEDKDRLSSSDH